MMRLLVAMALLLLAGAGPGCAADTSPVPPTLVYGTPFQPNTLNPITAPDIVSRSAIEMVFDGLVVSDDRMNLLPGLATRWETSSDGKQWTFYLRPGVTWHDGEAFTADDVVFTYQTVIDPDTKPTVSKADFASIQSVRALDELTVRFTLKRPDAAFLSRMVLGIVPEHVLGGQDLATASLNSQPVGTGPFMFESWTKGEQLVLRSNPGYFGGQPKSERLVWKVVPDSSVLALQAATGEVHGAPLFNPADLDALQASGTLTLRDTLDGNTQISLQLENPLFQDPRVRHALAHAIDTRAITDKIMRGTAVPATSDILPVSWAYNPNVATYPYDPVRASALMAEAGWKPGPNGVLSQDGEPFRMTLMTDAGHETREQVMLAVSQYWTDLGIEVKTGVQERNSFIFQRVLKGDFDAVLLQSAVQIDPDISRRFHTRSIGAGQNFLGYSNPRVDRLLDDALLVSDRSERRRAYFEVQRIMAEDLPQISLFHSKTIYAFATNLTGVKPAPTGLFWNVEEWEWAR